MQLIEAYSQYPTTFSISTEQARIYVGAYATFRQVCCLSSRTPWPLRPPLRLHTQAVATGYWPSRFRRDLLSAHRGRLLRVDRFRRALFRRASLVGGSCRGDGLRSSLGCGGGLASRAARPLLEG